MKMNRTVISVSMFYAFIFMGMGSISSYLSLYYVELKLSDTEIGFLTAIGAVMAVLGQPVWGVVTDRAGYKNSMLSLCILFTALSIWLMPALQGFFWPFAAATAVFFFFQTAINPISDSIALELSSQNHFRFSTIRMFGSLGFAAVSAAAGWVLDRNIHWIFPLFFLFMLFALALSFAIPKVEGHQKDRKVGFAGIFQNRKLVSIYLYVFVIEITFGYFISFHAIFTVQRGMSEGLLGLGIMLGSFSQFPFMMWFERWYQKYGLVRIILFSGFVHGLRWLLYAFMLNPVTLCIGWILHGGTFILMYLCLAQFVNDHIRSELKSSGQMMNSIILTGGGRIVGGMAGGVMAGLYGYQDIFIASAAICFAATLGFWLFTRKSPLFQQAIAAGKHGASL